MAPIATLVEVALSQGGPVAGVVAPAAWYLARMLRQIRDTQEDHGAALMALSRQADGVDEDRVARLLEDGAEPEDLLAEPPTNDHLS